MNICIYVYMRIYGNQAANMWVYPHTIVQRRYNIITQEFKLTIYNKRKRRNVKILIFS